MRTVVGCVGQLYQGDLDLGRMAAERLAAENLGPDVIVEDFHYGAVAVSQRLEDLASDALVLVGAAERGRAPGAVERRRIGAVRIPPDEARHAVAEAATGYVTIDLVLEVAAAFGGLPPAVVAVEVEPARTGPSDGLSAEGLAGLERALALVREEVRRLSRHPGQPASP